MPGNWDNLVDAPVAVDPVDIAHEKDEEDVIVQDDLGKFKVPRGLPEPIASDRETRLRHDLTYLPYAS